MASWLSLSHFTSKGLCSQPHRNTHELSICESILFPIIPLPSLLVNASLSAPRHGAGGRGRGLAWDLAVIQDKVLCWLSGGTAPSPPCFHERLFPSTHPSDMDECEIFGFEFCRNGWCLNIVPGYKCFCYAGYYYDSSSLECVGKMCSKSSGHPLHIVGQPCCYTQSCPCCPCYRAMFGQQTSWGMREEVSGALRVPIWTAEGSHCPCLST